jgi:hypothetical protein
MTGWAVADNQFTQAQIIEYLTAPAQGGNRLYFLGQIDYVDAFGEPRWTRFCISFTGWHALIPLAQDGKWDEISKKISTPGTSFNFEAANQHNEST